MHLIYAHNYMAARNFALAHEFMPGDWAWLHDAGVLRQYPRADIYKAPRWEANPLRPQIDEAIERARRERRLGTVVEPDGDSGTLGVSGA